MFDSVGERLGDPPLIEAVCEFRFAGDSWPQDGVGRLQDALGPEFEPAAVVIDNQIEVQVAPGGSPTAQMKPRYRHQIKRRDGALIVQLDLEHRVLVLNHLKPYEVWEKFRPVILTTLGAAKVALGLANCVRAGLRYINQIAMPPENEISDILVVAPPLPTELRLPLLTFFQRYDIGCAAPPGILVHQSGLMREPASTLMLDLDFGSTQPVQVEDPSSAVEWLNGAHGHVDAAFRASLQPSWYERLRKG